MRDQTEIKEFALEVIDQTGDVDINDTVFSIREKIANDQKLNAYEADNLVEILGGAARAQMEKVLRKGSAHSIVLETDVLSLYADVWGQYCRTDMLSKGA